MHPPPPKKNKKNKSAHATKARKEKKGGKEKNTKLFNRLQIMMSLSLVSASTFFLCVGVFFFLILLF